MIAHLYVRFSTLEQKEGTSTARQRAYCEAEIEARGWSLGSVLIDEGKSAFSGAHRGAGTELGRFVSEAMAGEHFGEVLVVERIDRLSREGADETFAFIKELGRAGVSVASVDGKALYSPDQKFELIDVITLWIKAELAREESVKKAERGRDAHEINRKKAAGSGGTVGAACPGWLTKIDGRYVEIKDRVKLVREIFALADQAQGSITIAKLLNKRGEPLWNMGGKRPQKAWDNGRIRKILADPAAIGEHHVGRWVNGRYIVTGEILKVYPRIIELDQWARVREGASTRAETRGGGRSATVVNLFAGLARCRHCGGVMEYKRSRKEGSEYKGRNGAVRILNRENGALYCKAAYLHGKVCQNRAGVTMYGLEKAVLATVLHIALDDRSFANDSDALTLARQLAEAQREYDQTQAQAEAFWRAWAESGGNSDMRQRLAEDAEAKAKALKGTVEALTLARAKAAGRVSDEEHRSRVEEVRSHLHDEDLDVRARYRRQVLEGLRGIITLMECDDTRTTTIGLAGALGALRVQGGKVTEANDALHMFRDGKVESLGGEREQRAAKRIIDRVALSSD